MFLKNFLNKYNSTSPILKIVIKNTMSFAIAVLLL